MLFPERTLFARMSEEKNKKRKLEEPPPPPYEAKEVKHRVEVSSLKNYTFVTTAAKFPLTSNNDSMSISFESSMMPTFGDALKSAQTMLCSQLIEMNLGVSETVKTSCRNLLKGGTVKDVLALFTANINLAPCECLQLLILVKRHTIKNGEMVTDIDELTKVDPYECITKRPGLSLARCSESPEDCSKLFE